jgi:SAM-dependent methyltransferase
MDAPVDRQLADRYSASAADYARCWSPVIRPMGQRLIRAMPLADASAVLDVGTGVGALVPDIRAAAPGALVVGVDGAVGMLRVARRAVPIPVAAMDARRLGFRTGGFDAAVLIFVLFHLPDPVSGLVEIGRILRPGGMLGVTTWGVRAGFAASDVWDEELAAAGAGPDPADTPDRDDLMDTPEKLGALFIESGFAGVETWSDRFAHRWAPDTLIAQRTGWGSYRRRLDTLEVDARDACLVRIRERLATLAADDFVFRPEIVFALGRHRGTDKRARAPPNNAQIGRRQEKSGGSTMAKLIYVGTHGPDDPTKACMPIHLAVNGAAEAGIEAEINLAGDAAVLIQDAYVNTVVPVGFPPLKDLMAKAAEKGVRVYI